MLLFFSLSLTEATLFIGAPPDRYRGFFHISAYQRSAAAGSDSDLAVQDIFSELPSPNFAIFYTQN